MDNIPLPDLDDWDLMYKMTDKELEKHISNLEKEIDTFYKDYDKTHILRKKALMLKLHLQELRMARWNREVEIMIKSGK